MEYRVILTIGGAISHGSCIYCGPLANCEACAGRMNRQPGKHRTHQWAVVPCIGPFLESSD